MLGRVDEDRWSSYGETVGGGSKGVLWSVRDLRLGIESTMDSSRYLIGRRASCHARPRRVEMNVVRNDSEIIRVSLAPIHRNRFVAALKQMLLPFSGTVPAQAAGSQQDRELHAMVPQH